MIIAHVLAAIVLGLVLAKGEDAVWFVARLLVPVLPSAPTLPSIGRLRSRHRTRARGRPGFSSSVVSDDVAHRPVAPLRSPDSLPSVWAGRSADPRHHTRRILR